MRKTKNIFKTTKEMEKAANKLLKILDMECRFGNLTMEECLNVVGIVGAAVAMSQEDTSQAAVIKNVDRMYVYMIDSATSMLLDVCKAQLKKEENEL